MPLYTHMYYSYNKLKLFNLSSIFFLYTKCVLTVMNQARFQESGKITDGQQLILIKLILLQIIITYRIKMNYYFHNMKYL